MQIFFLVMQTRQVALRMLDTEMETQIGLNLLDRHTRMVALADVGVRLYTITEETLADLENAVSNAQELISLRSGCVSVAASTAMCARLFSKAFRQFKECYPDIKFIFSNMAGKYIIDLVKAGKINLDVGTALGLEQGINETPLLNGRYIALAPPVRFGN